MKKHQFISSATTFVAGLALVLGLVGHDVSAATGQIYLTPASPSVLNGNNVTLSLRINPGTTVDGVQATVNFDTSKLQYVSVDTSGSAFSVALQQSQSGSTITIARGDFSGVSSDALVENITFKALVGSGTSGVTLTNANATDHSTSTYTNPTVGNATVSFTSPSCPAGQTGTYPNCSTPTSSGGTSSGGTTSGGTTKTPTTTKPPTTTPPSTTPPATTGTDGTPALGVTNVQFTKADITASTKVPTQVYIQFGQDKDKLDQQTPLSALATTHNITVDDLALTPGQTYYYLVVSKDQQGHIAQSSIQSFTTKGLTIMVGVYDKNHKPLAKKKVTLHSTPMTGTTDDKGFVTFSNVMPGDHTVIYGSGKKTYQQKVAVANNVKEENSVQSAAVQNLSVVYGLTQDSNMVLRLAIVAALLAVVIIVAVVLARRQVKFAAPTGAPLSMNPVVIGGTTPTWSDYQAGATPAAQQTMEHLNNIPDPQTPSPGSTVAPREGEVPNPPYPPENPPGPNSDWRG